MTPVLPPRLQKAAAKPGHAYLFIGDGDEKRTAAAAFARALLCEQNGSCACYACRLSDAGTNPDVFYVKAAKTKSLGVDDVRDQIVAPVALMPFRFKYKIFITDYAETLTPQAQNALLKTIEEPPAHGVFLFLAAHTHTLLPTFRSRVVPFHFYGENAGQEASLSDEALYALARTVAETAQGLSIPAMYGLVAQIDKVKDSIRPFLDILYRLYAEKRQTRQADAVALAKRHLTQNANFQMTIECLMMTLN